jgi:DNA primase
MMQRRIRKFTAEAFRMGVSDEACSEYFQNRIVFPVLDDTGRVMGFRGKSFTDPASPCLPWPKGAGLTDYPLGLVPENIKRIRTFRFVVIVEGEFDMLSAYQAGLPAVAIMTSRLRPFQVQRLAQFTGNAVVWADPDTPGFKGGLESENRLRDFGFATRLFYVPGMDPNDVLVQHGEEAIKSLVVDAIRPDEVELPE